MSDEVEGSDASEPDREEDVASEVPPPPGADAEERRLVLSVPTASLRTLGVIAVVAVLLVLLVFQWRRASNLSSASSQRTAVATAAGAFGEAMMSYDFHDLAGARKRVLRLSTKQFAGKYTEAFSTGLQPLISQLEATATASVHGVYVSDLKRDVARAVVVLDSQVRSKAGVRTLSGSYLEMGLKRQGGRWKVDEVTAVAAAGENVTPPPESASLPGLPAGPSAESPTTTVAP